VKHSFAASISSKIGLKGKSAGNHDLYWEKNRDLLEKHFGLLEKHMISCKFSHRK
jgi:hypothetical protein